MKQQINLYSYLPQKQRLPFTFNLFFILSTAFVLLILLDIQFTIWQKYRQEARLSQIEKQIELERDHVSRVLAEYPALSSADLDLFVKQLNEQLGARVKLQSMITKGSSFSGYLKALGTAILPKVWLTEIYISRLDQKIILRGNTLEAMAAQQFLGQLTRQPIFAKKPFFLEKVAHVPTKTYLSFEVQSQGSPI